MKSIFTLIVIVVISGGAFYMFANREINPPVARPQMGQNRDGSLQNTQAAPLTAVVAEALDTPWGIAFLPDGNMLVTERKGTVRFVNSSGVLDPNPVITLQNVEEVGEGGLLGIAVHPNFSTNKYVYFYYTYSSAGSNTLNRVIRMTYQNKKLTDERTILDQIPGASNHNGGRIKFGPDKFLYIATGDAQEPSLAQDKNSLAGKILRITDTGQAAPGNPFNNRTYSYGHRNPQGLTWDTDGVLWSTEHGPSGLQSGNDELNKITAGGNYGWPDIQGNESRSGMMNPIAHSGTADTWAPASAAYINGTIYFGGLRGRAVYKAAINGSKVSITEHFNNEFGRIREVIAGPDGMLYITTSNRDGRGIPGNGDDRLIRVNPQKM